MKILHIAAHYGGGVGTVMSALKEADTGNTHIFTYLNPGNVGTPFNITMIPDADIVLLHFWNHPSVFEFLINTPLPLCRLIIWSHVSGLYPPSSFSHKLIDYVDKFVFTTPASFAAKEVAGYPDKGKFDVIWSTYGIDKFTNFQKRAHTDFNIGFIGTADYGKLRSDFIDLCGNVHIPNVRFTICTSDSQDHLKNRVMALDISDKFSFKGKVSNVVKELELFDVFGYPLQSKHFGSCEQSLGEAMICGVVPVVFNNKAEQHIVQHNQNGLIVNTPEEYCKAIEYLYHNTQELTRMSSNAVEAAKALYNIDHTISQWNNLFDEIYTTRPKIQRQWTALKLPPYRVYIISMGDYGAPFNDYVYADRIGDMSLKNACKKKILELYDSNLVFNSTNKGSIYQYRDFYKPTVDFLEDWCNL